MRPCAKNLETPLESNNSRASKTFPCSRSISQHFQIALPLPASAMSSDPSSRSPTLHKLLKTRLAPIREKELIAKALSSRRPVKPPAGDCCASSCKPCIMDLYREELKVWKECWKVEDGGETNASQRSDAQTENCKLEARAVVDGDVSPRDERERRRMPGSFDW